MSNKSKPIKKDDVVIQPQNMKLIFKAKFKQIKGDK